MNWKPAEPGIKSARNAGCKDGGFRRRRKFFSKQKGLLVGHNNKHNNIILPSFSTKEFALNIIKYIKVYRPPNKTWEL